MGAAGTSGLRVEGLTTGYGRQPAVHQVSMEIPWQAFGAVVGPNGAGKSSLLRALSGLNARWRGQIYWDGEDVSSLAASARVERGIVAVLQGAPSFPNLTVDENLRIASKISSNSPIQPANVLDHFPELARRRSLRAISLSGGERQMLALGRAMCAGPALLLIDEPSFGLAVGVRYRLLEIIDDLRRRFGWTVLMAEQDVNMIKRADPVYYMSSGEISHSDVGPVGEVIAEARQKNG